MHNEKISGIYKIENKINKKVYIGQSINIYYRWTDHKKDLNKGIHNNKYLQNDWNIYGENNFEFSIIEECEQENLDMKEIYWINSCNALNKDIGYNISSGNKVTNKIKNKEQNNTKQDRGNYKWYTPPKIAQVDFNGNLVKVWKSATQVERTIGINASQILENANQTGKYRHVRGYIWMFINDFESFNIVEYKNKYKRSFGFPILQYDLSGKETYIYYSEKEILERHPTFKISSIRDVCTHKNKTYKGYIWKYPYDIDFEINDNYLIRCKFALDLLVFEQLDLNMNYIKDWCRRSLCITKNRIFDYSELLNLFDNENKIVFYNGYYWRCKKSNKE